MKKAILTVLCMVLASGLLVFSGCSAADTPGDNDTITTREFAYSEFTDLEIDAGFSVEIIEDDTYMFV